MKSGIRDQATNEIWCTSKWQYELIYQ